MGFVYSLVCLLMKKGGEGGRSGATMSGGVVDAGGNRAEGGEESGGDH
jgi:hypothetical protein